MLSPHCLVQPPQKIPAGNENEDEDGRLSPPEHVHDGIRRVVGGLLVLNGY